VIHLQNIIGLPVFEMEHGKRVGELKDAWFDEYWRPGGLVLTLGRKCFVPMKLILWTDVVTIGNDVIMIKNARCIYRQKHGEIGRFFSTGLTRLKDLPLVTESGQVLGRIADVYFTPVVDKPIVGYELTDGFIADIIEGRKWLPVLGNTEDLLRRGEDVIIVPNVAAEQVIPVKMN
jgi:uncharacterized protein YrrD